VGRLIASSRAVRADRDCILARLRIRTEIAMRRLTSSAMLVAWVSQLVPLLPEPARAAEPTTIRCESSARETVRCAADTSSGVTLARQLSRAGCWYDETWGYDTRGVWVSNGCRADFTLGGGAPAVGPTGSTAATEESSGSGISGSDIAIGAAAALVVGAIAAAVIAGRDDDDDDDDDDDRYGRDPWKRDKIVRCESERDRQRYCKVDTRRGVEVYRRLSKSPCRYGKSWGYNRRGIWVDDGCRADFVVRG
jgi:hypothetical protein